MGQQHFDWIDYVKGIAIILVVIGHSFPDASTQAGIENEYLRALHDGIYQFHMPLMFFISGMLSSKILRISTTSERRLYIKDRFRRLMVPYFSIALLYLPFKIILSNFANQPYDISGIWMIMFGENPDGGLWFLYSLFLIQVVMCLFVRRHDLRTVLIASILIAFVITYLDTKWFRVDDAIFYLCFVVAGLYYSTSIYYKKKTGVISIIAAALLLIAFIWLFFKTEDHYYRVFSGFLGVAVMIGIAKRANVKNLIGKKITGLGRYTMDIYIFHGILMVVARIVFYSLLGWNYYLCCVIMLTVGLLMPVLISKYIVRKVSVLRAFLLGDFKKK